MQCPYCSRDTERKECFEKRIILEKDESGNWQEKGILTSVLIYSCQNCYTQFILDGPKKVNVDSKKLTELYHPSILAKL
jgi:hypothetical protein